MAKQRIETDDGARIATLSSLGDFQVAEGYTDIRGWRVEGSDGKEVGRVHELLVDLDGMRTRYLDVRLNSALAATEGDRDVLIPIGAARIDDGADKVVVALAADRIGLLPAFDHKHLLRSHESEIRRHFSLGEAAAASAVAAGAGATSRSDEFYDHAVYDDRRFFSSRRPAADARGDTVRDDETVTRIPVDPQDSVVLKRGESGEDEIIVRRPRQP